MDVKAALCGQHVEMVTYKDRKRRSSMNDL